MEKELKHIKHPASEKGGTEAAWSRLYKRLEEDGLLMEQPRRRIIDFHAPLVRIAAAVLVLLAIGGPALWLDLRNNPGSQEELQHFSEEGVNTVDLPDGSRVFLNEGSELSFPASFSDERRVKLKGEGFFEVMSDPASPFIVYSGRVAVTVLGTTFNVKESEGRQQVEVSVESGKVRMSTEESGTYLNLEAGDLGRSDGAELHMEKQSDTNYLSWKTKDFKFVDKALDEVLPVLERSYHIRIHSEEVETGEMRITSTYQEQSADAIMETIAAAFGLKVSRAGKDYYLRN